MSEGRRRFSSQSVFMEMDYYKRWWEVGGLKPCSLPTYPSAHYCPLGAGDLESE